ncbi:MAG: hypothetical protein V1494_05660 [Candidatus Diapherotrites archaeon]
MKAEELNQLIVKEKFLIAAAIAVLFITLFSVLAGFVLAVLLIMAGVGLKVWKKKESAEELVEQKNALQEELSLAEKKFMTRKLDEKSYNEMREDLQRKLISLEARIEARKMRKEFGRLSEVKAKKLEPKRRHKLNDLLNESEMLLKELSIANSKYLKRKIDEKTYRQLASEKQKRLVGIEAEINRIYRQEAAEIMGETQRKIALSEEQRIKEKAEEIVEDLLEQEEEAAGQGKETRGKPQMHEHQRRTQRGAGK